MKIALYKKRFPEFMSVEGNLYRLTDVVDRERPAYYWKLLDMAGDIICQSDHGWNTPSEAIHNVLASLTVMSNNRLADYTVELAD